jgi:riboflavin synthase
LFTGLIQDCGRIESLRRSGADLQIVVGVGRLPLERLQPGDSIALNGVCLTVTGVEARCFTADDSAETLAVTTLKELTEGARVNLEPSLRLGDALGGHLVSGHVDGIAELTQLHADGRSMRMRFRVPRELARYVARKGSVTIDGVSLTVNEVDAQEFGVNIIPHTLSATTLGEYRPGRRVNLEVDQIMRYLERLTAEVP